MRIRSFFVPLLLLSFAVQSNAQQSRNRVVTTDYNECLVGVKDTNGRWIIPAQYTTINHCYQTKSMFLVWQYRKCGLADSNGVLVVPVMYDEIRPSDAVGYYIVRNNDRQGVVNSSNNTVVPAVYRLVSVAEDSVCFACMKKRKWEMYTPEGARYKVPYKSRYAPRRVGPGFYSARKAKLFGNDKFALINDSAQTVLKGEWEMLGSTKHNLIYLQKDGHYGYIDYNGKTVWPVMFDYVKPAFLNEFYGHYSKRYTKRHFKHYTPSSNIFSRDSIAPARLHSKYGLISVSGRTILPFEYDSISAYGSSTRLPYSSIYYVKKNGRYGIYSTREGWIQEPVLEILEPLRTYRTSTDSLTVTVFLDKKNGYYGISSSAGQTFVPCRYRNYSKVPGGFLLYNSDTLVRVDCNPRFLKDLVVQSQLDIPRDSAIPYYSKTAFAREIPDSKQFAVCTNEEGRKIFFHPNGRVKELEVNYKKFTAQAKNRFTAVPDSVLMNAEISVQYLLPLQQTDDQHILYRDSLSGSVHTFVLNLATNETEKISTTYRDHTHLYYRTETGYLFRDDGLVLNQPHQWEEVVTLTTEGKEPHKFLLTSNDSCAVMNGDGTYFIPVFKGRIGYFNEKYMWTTPETHRQMYLIKKWSLTDRRTGATVKWKYDDTNSMIWGNRTVATSKKQGAQLINLVHNEVVVAGYNKIEGLNKEGSLFLVRTCSGKTGIIDSTGKIVVDTIYQNLTEVQKNESYLACGSVDAYERYLQFFHYYALYNDTGYAVFDAEKHCLTGKQMITDNLKSTMRVNNDSVPVLLFPRWTRAGESTFVSISRSDSARMREWHWRSLTDSVCLPHRYNGSNISYGRFSFVNQCEYCMKKNDVNYYIRPTTSSETFVVKHAADSLLSFYTHTYKTDLMSNVMLFSDGPRNVTLDSLFRPDTDWKNFIINTVLTYVNDHLYVRGDCHNPAGFPVMLNNRFLLTENGIALYPEDFTERSAELIITIPWNSAMPYLRQDIKPKLPLN